MKKLLGIIFLVLFIMPRVNGQLPLLVNNKPNKEINRFLERSCNCLKEAYDTFINDSFNDSLLIEIFHLNKKNTNFKKFKIYILPQAYYKSNITEWRSSDLEISNYIEIDTNRCFGSVYFLKGKSTYIIGNMLYSNNPHFDFVSDIYFTNETRLNTIEAKKVDKRFYKYILKAKPDYIFTLRGYSDLICFQKGTKVYFYNHFGNRVESLNYYEN